MLFPDGWMPILANCIGNMGQPAKPEPIEEAEVKYLVNVYFDHKHMGSNSKSISW